MTPFSRRRFLQFTGAGVAYAATTPLDAVLVPLPAPETLQADSPNALVGGGFNTALLKKKKQIVQGGLAAVDRGTAPEVKFGAVVLENSYDFERLEKLSAEVKGNYGSASAKNSFTSAKSLKVNRYSSYLACSLGVLFPPEEITEPTLTRDASEFLEQPAEFLRQFGDGYVKGVRRGGYLDVVFEVRSSSEKEKTDISNKLSAAASGMGMNGSASVSYKKAITAITKFSNSIAHISGVFPPGTNLPKLSIEELMDFCLKYPSLLDVKTNNQIVSVLIDDAANIGGIKKDPVDRQRSVRQRELHHAMVEAIQNFYDWDNDIGYVVNNPKQFASDVLEAAKNDSALVSDRIRELEKLTTRLITLEDPDSIAFDENRFVIEAATYPRSEKPAPSPPRRKKRKTRAWWKIG